MTRVLVVEDEESYSDALAYMLRKEGFEVGLAATGPDALIEFDRAGADIVLLDLMLPGLPGTEVCRRIRQTSNVPVIMVSAKDDEVDKVVGLELGADDYITKPYSPRELVARIRAVLRRGVEPDLAPQTLEVGPVRMDVERHTVTVDGTDDVWRICRQTSVPGIPGSIRSSRTMSGPKRSNSVRAVLPSAAPSSASPSRSSSCSRCSCATPAGCSRAAS